MPASSWRRRSAAGALVLTLLLALSPAWCVQWIVDDDGPADFRSLQAAVDAYYVHSGDVLLVRPGYYPGNVVINSKDLVIRSEAGPLVTILDAMDSGSVVSLQNRTAAMRIEGFTIRGGRDQTGGGLWIYGGGPLITRNIIEGNEAVGGFLGYGYGGGIEIYASAAVVTRNLIRGNRALDGGGGIDIYYAGPSTPGSCCPLIAQNTIEDNLVTSPTGIGGAILVSASQPWISSSILTNNSAASGGGVYVEKIQGTNDLPAVSANILHANLPDASASNVNWRLPSSNLMADPMISDDPWPGPRPRSGSPALDVAEAGLPQGADLFGWTHADSDLDGTVRGDAGAVENRGEISGLDVSQGPAGAAAITWDGALLPSVHFHLYVSVSGFKSDGGACLAGFLTSPAWQDTDPLPPGQARFYLVAGHGLVEGSRGFHSDGSAVSSVPVCP